MKDTNTAYALNLYIDPSNSPGCVVYKTDCVTLDRGVAERRLHALREILDKELEEFDEIVDYYEGYDVSGQPFWSIQEVPFLG